MRRYVGLDIHKKFLFAVVLDSKGDLISEKKVKNEPWELDKFFKGIDKDSNIALESLEKYNVDGKPDAGQFVNESEQWEYKNLTSYPIDTFVGVACPGNFTKLSTMMKAFNETFGYVNWSARLFYGNHITDGQLYRRILDVLKLTNPDLYYDFPFFFRFGAKRLDSSRMSINIYNEYYNWINNPNSPRLGDSVTINNLAIIQGNIVLQEGISQPLAFSFRDIGTDGIVPIDDQKEICNNANSNNKYYVNFNNIRHFGTLTVCGLPDCREVKNVISEFITSKEISSGCSYNYSKNSC